MGFFSGEPFSDLFLLSELAMQAHLFFEVSLELPAAILKSERSPSAWLSTIHNTPPKSRVASKHFDLHLKAGTNREHSLEACRKNRASNTRGGAFARHAIGGDGAEVPQSKVVKMVLKRVASK